MMNFQFTGIFIPPNPFQSRRVERHPAKFLAAFRFQISRSFRTIQAIPVLSTSLSFRQYAGRPSFSSRQNFSYFATHLVTFLSS